MKPQAFLELQRAQAGDLAEIAVERGGRHMHHGGQIFNTERSFIIGAEPGNRLVYPVCPRPGCAEKPKLRPRLPDRIKNVSRA